MQDVQRDKTLKRLHARSFCLGGRGPVRPVGPVGPGEKHPAPTTRLAFLPTTACTRSWTPLDSLNQADETNGTRGQRARKPRPDPATAKHPG